MFQESDRPKLSIGFLAIPAMSAKLCSHNSLMHCLAVTLLLLFSFVSSPVQGAEKQITIGVLAVRGVEQCLKELVADSRLSQQPGSRLSICYPSINS